VITRDLFRFDVGAFAVLLVLGAVLTLVCTPQFEQNAARADGADEARALAVTLAIWQTGYLNGGLSDEARAAVPEPCRLFEDGSGSCGALVIPAYDEFTLGGP
jgi:hypothetical protein